MFKLTAVRKFVLPLSLLAFSGVASAASACTSALTLQQLINAGACQYFDKVFSNFLFNFSGGTSNQAVGVPLVPDATNVDVSFSTPSGFVAPGVPADPTLTFTFTANNTVAPYQNMVLTIQYQVNVVGGGAVMTGMSGSATGSYTTAQTVTDGTDTHTLNPAGHPLQMQKYACIDGAFDTGNAPFPSQLCDGTDSGTVINTGAFSYPGSNLSLSSTLTKGGSFTYPLVDRPVTQVGAFDVFTIVGGTTSDNTGSTTPTAQAVSMQNSFLEVPAPEPGTMVLIGGSLFALGYIRRRKSAL
jgi:hypothetical protein